MESRDAHQKEPESEDDPIYRMYNVAEPIGVPLTNEELDHLIYGI